MSLFILDTDVLSLLHGGHARIEERIRQTDPKRIAVAVVTIEEQLSGWYTVLRKAKTIEKQVIIYERLAENVRRLGRYQILSFTKTSLQRRDDLHRGKLNIGKRDLGIAAIAMEIQATVVTRNLRDFQRVPGLQIEDWSQ